MRGLRWYEFRIFLNSHPKANKTKFLTTFVVNVENLELVLYSKDFKTRVNPNDPARCQIYIPARQV
jgi:hypothetical protein